jgi:hypothetical protein
LKATLLRRHAHEDCRVVDQTVDFAVCIERFARKFLAAGEISDIHVHAERFASTVRNRLGYSLRRGTVDISYDGGSAFTRDP